MIKATNIEIKCTCGAFRYRDLICFLEVNPRVFENPGTYTDSTISFVFSFNLTGFKAQAQSRFWPQLNFRFSIFESLRFFSRATLFTPCSSYSSLVRALSTDCRGRSAYANAVFADCPRLLLLVQFLLPRTKILGTTSCNYIQRGNSRDMFRVTTEVREGTFVRILCSVIGVCRIF